jgi:hypothetical protein
MCQTLLKTNGSSRQCGENRVPSCTGVFQLIEYRYAGALPRAAWALIASFTCSVSILPTSGPDG